MCLLLLLGPNPGFAEVKENLFLLDSINMSHGTTNNRSVVNTNRVAEF